MMARCVRKYGKEKTRCALFRNAEDACLYMVCSGSAFVLLSALRVVPRSPQCFPICAAFFLWSFAFCARNTLCESPRVTHPLHVLALACACCIDSLSPWAFRKCCAGKMHPETSQHVLCNSSSLPCDPDRLPSEAFLSVCAYICTRD
jgi:hypothetical protein